jgi:anti-sigma B factor antagonist
VFAIIQPENLAHTLIIEVVGRLDSDHAEMLTEQAHTALSTERVHLILDLSAVSFINSAGLRALVQTIKGAQASGGSLTLINPSESVRRALELVGLDSVLPIVYEARWNPLHPQLAPVAWQTCVLA